MHTKADERVHRWPSVWGQAAALVGLAAVAITQPVLDLMGRNPEFFIAGRYTSAQIVQFALVVALVPSAIVVGIFVVARLVHRGVGDVVHGALLALLGGLFGNVLVRGLGADGTTMAIAATVGGAAFALLVTRGRGGRMLLQYLAAANVLFLVGFLVISPVSQLLAGAVPSESLGTVTVPEPPGPVVVIVFDELPISTLMSGDGTINADRYPAFARLAAGSTWYRNASSVHPRTERAVPAIMTGNEVTNRVMPSYQDLPRNLLSLMSVGMPVERYESVTNLCPPDTCEARPSQSLNQGLSDAGVVFGHRVLPEALRADLAPIDDAWGSFGSGVDAATIEAPADDGFDEDDPLARYRGFDGAEREPETQAARLVEQGLKVGATPALHFVHVVLPHSPWHSTPWGTRVMPPMPDWVEDPALPGFGWSELVRYQRHSLQTGATDVALGQVLDHLESSGAWDDATIVVTADHGTSTLGPDLGRDVTDANRDEVLRVPLFIKEAGQTEPVVDDAVALTIDILPTLIDLLDIETDWSFEGHSLVDGSEREVEPYVPTEMEPLMEIVRRHEAHFPHGTDWTALAAVGDHGALVGTPLADLEIGVPSALRWAPTNEASFGALPNEKREVPQVMIGGISGSGDDPPPSVLVVANGTVAGATGGYERQADGAWAFTSVLGNFFVDGANQVDAYEVTTVDGRPVLHLLG